MIPVSTIAHARQVGGRHAAARLRVTRPGDPGEVEYDEAGEPVDAPDVPRVTVLDEACRVTDDVSAIRRRDEGPVMEAGPRTAGVNAIVRLDPGQLSIGLENELTRERTDHRIELFYGPRDRRVVRRVSVTRVEHGQTVTRLFVRFLDVAGAA